MDTRQTVQLSVLTALAISIYTVESLLPNPVPWMRLGLSNAVVLLGIVGFGIRGGVLISLLRTILGSFILGTFLSPSFFFSLFGGLSSAVLMAVLYRFLRRALSLVGISICGALAHNGAQLALASSLFIGRPEVMLLLPIFGFASLVAGTLTGFIVHFLSLRTKFANLEPQRS